MFLSSFDQTPNLAAKGQAITGEVQAFKEGEQRLLRKATESSRKKHLEAGTTAAVLAWWDQLIEQFTVTASDGIKSFSLPVGHTYDKRGATSNLSQIEAAVELLKQDGFEAECREVTYCGPDEAGRFTDFLCRNHPQHYVQVTLKW